MIQHPNLRLWEKRLKVILDGLDEVLEDAYGQKYRLHPSRPGRGKTGSKAHDGLFDISAHFTLGLGSEKGKGYVIDIRMVTLEMIPQDVEDQVDETAMQFIRKELKKVFPDKNLWVDRDGTVLKLHGDLSLGEV